MAALLALAGFMGSGKTSVGTLAADLLGWRFIDLDAEIVAHSGMSVSEIFARYGEADFRRREVESLSRVLAGEAGGTAGHGAEDGVVLALGGGTLQSPQAAAMLAERGGVVFLDIDADQAWERATGDNRPLAQDREAFAALLMARHTVYARSADWTIPVGDRSAEQIAREVVLVVRAAGPLWPRTWGLQLASTWRGSTIAGGGGCLALLRGLAAEVAGRGGRLFTVTDENVDRAWGGVIGELMERTAGRVPVLVLDPGERSKSPAGLERCWEWLAAAGARRDDVVVAVGGGVVGDLAGFAAATYQRGVGLWQIPTSLLAQVDSSVGGKTAVNLASGKNLVGAFYQPDVVVIDPDTLSTLPQQEFTNGLGEVVKCALLSGEALFASLEARREAVVLREPSTMSDIVRACVCYKAEVVEEDEFDTGRRAVLNLGHTTAHALEAGLGFGQIGHGEAVALGLLVALAVSERLLGLDPAVRERTRTLLSAVGLRTAITLPSPEVMVAAAGRDKKVKAGSSGFVGLRAPGEPVWGLDVPGEVFAEAVEVIRA
jgi:shikimate kinase / 3-dehydroquinate synthase